MDEYAPLMMLGIRVRQVKDLREGSIFYHRSNLLFVDADLIRSDREYVTAHFVPVVLESSEATTSEGAN